MTFYGREQEMQALRWQFQRAQETKVARMAVVTGRRRIGKTTLIRKAFEGSLDPQNLARFIDNNLSIKPNVLISF